MLHAPLPPEAEFLRLRDELLHVQHQLSSRLHQCADDPRLDLEDVASAVAALRERREALLNRWGRAGLAFLIQGGEIILRDPSTSTASPSEPSEAAARPAPGAPPAPSESAPSEPAPSEPEPEPEPEAEPEAAPPADPEALRQLAQGGLAPGWSKSIQTTPRPSVEPLDLQSLDATLRRVLGPLPESLTTAVTGLDELARLSEAIGQLEDWIGAPSPAQRALVGLLTARARRLQDEVPEGLLSAASEAALDRLFGALTGFSKREQPGFVYGLMRSHSPSEASWHAEAMMWSVRLSEAVQPEPDGNPEQALDALRATAGAVPPADPETFQAAVLEALDAGVAHDDPRLVRLAAPRVADLKTKARFKRLRKAIREAQANDEADAADFATEVAAGPSTPLAGWPWADAVRGKRAILIGGDKREDARVRIEAAFELDALEWITTDHTRHYQSVANRVTSGGCDLVILLRRFIGHDVDRIVIPACRAAGVPWVSVDRGYGVAQVRAAMERFLDAVEPSA